MQRGDLIWEHLAHADRSVRIGNFALKALFKPEQILKIAGGEKAVHIDELVM